jgi:hypothetical protein
VPFGLCLRRFLLLADEPLQWVAGALQGALEILLGSVGAPVETTGILGHLLIARHHLTEAGGPRVVREVRVHAPHLAQALHGSARVLLGLVEELAAGLALPLCVVAPGSLPDLLRGEARAAILRRVALVEGAILQDDREREQLPVRIKGTQLTALLQADSDGRHS